jgi:preprotein translocase subunit YajC
VESLAGLLPFLLILVAFYFLIIRPARNRQRAHQQLSSAMRVGQQVLTTSGLYATVAAIEDDAILLEVAPGVTTRWAKPAVARIVTPQDGDGDEGTDRMDDLDENDTADTDISEKRPE